MLKEASEGGAREIELAEVTEGESEDIRQTEDPTSPPSSLWGLTDSRPEKLYGRADDSQESVSSLTVSSNGEPESSTVHFDESVNIAGALSTKRQRTTMKQRQSSLKFSAHDEMMMIQNI